MIQYKLYRGAEILPIAKDLATLRVTIFRDYPYLYEGSVEEDMHYTSSIAQSESAFVILALDDDKVVGALTAYEMEESEAEVREPYSTTEYASYRSCYIGETLLLPHYQGRGGVGIRLYKRGEAIIREEGYEAVVVCTVDRASDDCRRPESYHDVNVTLRKLGFEVIPDLKATFWWREIGGGDEERENKMSYLVKTLD